MSPEKVTIMKRTAKGNTLPREQIAAVIEEIADGVAEGSLSFHLQLPIVQAQEAMVELRNVDGLKLLNRISMLLLTENREKKMRYEVVNKAAQEFSPLDPTEDSKALRALAEEIRNG